MFTELVERLKVDNVQFEDLYSIDRDSLEALSPVYGVVFLFKYGTLDRQYAVNNKPIDGEYDGEYQDKGIFFANQTIHNACATQAVLNVLMNVDIDLGPELTNFKTFVTGFDGEMIGETISNSDLIRSVHNSFSLPSLIEEGKRDKPDSDDDDGLFHFVGYVNINDQIYELDGLKKYPIAHDKLDGSLFAEKLPEVLHRRIAKYGNELRFSLLAITNDKLKAAEELGDEGAFNREVLKRETWRRENALRRHDYTGLIVNLIKNISRGLSNDEYNQLLNDARTRSQARLR